MVDAGSSVATGGYGIAVTRWSDVQWPLTVWPASTVQPLPVTEFLASHSPAPECSDFSSNAHRTSIFVRADQLKIVGACIWPYGWNRF